MSSNIRVAARYRFMQKRAISEYGDADVQTKEFADFLAGQVDGLDDASVAYGCYASYAVQGSRQHLIAKLVPRLLLSYRKRLIGWLAHGILKRANIGSGGRKEEVGLQNWVSAIPKILVAKDWNHKLSDYLPDNEYLNPDNLEPVSKKIIRACWEDATAAGVLGGQSKTAAGDMKQMTLRPDPRTNTWYIDSYDTFQYREALKTKYRFKWIPARKRWETESLTKLMIEDFTTVGLPAGHAPIVQTPKPLSAPPKKVNVVTPEIAVPESAAEKLAMVQAWFMDIWYPANVGRFSKVFTDVARNRESSYKIIFSVAGGQPKVDFERNINTAAEAVEELRYRYIGRQGREAWLEVLDRYADLIETTSISKLPPLIDRINNLEHSNGAFSEHYPASVKACHAQFLNSKYSAPTGADLAKYIPDKDLRMVMIEANQRGMGEQGLKPVTWKYEPPDAYHIMIKDLNAAGGKTWRELGYPRYKGDAGRQVSRFDPRVQKSLDTFKKLELQKDTILATVPASATEYEKVTQSYEDWKKDYSRFQHEFADVLAELERVKQIAHARDLDDPNFIAQWEKEHPPGSEKLANRVAGRFLSE